MVVTGGCPTVPPFCYAPRDGPLARSYACANAARPPSAIISFALVFHVAIAMPLQLSNNEPLQQALKRKYVVEGDGELVVHDPSPYELRQFMADEMRLGKSLAAYKRDYGAQLKLPRALKDTLASMRARSAANDGAYPSMNVPAGRGRDGSGRFSGGVAGACSFMVRRPPVPPPVASPPPAPPPAPSSCPPVPLAFGAALALKPPPTLTLVRLVAGPGRGHRGASVVPTGTPGRGRFMSAWWMQ